MQRSARMGHDSPGVTTPHDMQEAIKLADEIAFIDQGKLKFYGSPKQLMAMDDQITDAFISSHKIQLTLLTRTIKDLIDQFSIQKKIPHGAPRLFFRNNFMEGMDLFKKTKQDALGVYSGKHYQGHLKKEDLLAAMQSTLKECLES